MSVKLSVAALFAVTTLQTCNLGTTAAPTRCPDELSVGNYATLTPSEQLDYHWRWTVCTEYGTEGNPDLEQSGWDLLVNAARGVTSSALRLGRAFRNTTDELDEGRTKLLHPYGTVARLRWESSPYEAVCDTEYTGVFAEDDVDALARFSWGLDPEAVGYMPGMALKFFVDGGPSVNLHAIPSLEPSDDPSFFGGTLTNVLPPVESGVMRVLVAYFAKFADSPLHLRVGHVARVHTDGSTVTDWTAPYKLHYQPTSEAFAHYQAALDADADVDFREALATLPIGTPIYEVFATDAPGGCTEYIGRLVLRSRVVASEWGDERLYFQHGTDGQGIE